MSNKTKLVTGLVVAAVAIAALSMSDLFAQVVPSTATAAALSVNPSNCASGKAAGGIAADGTAEDCTTYLQSVADLASGYLYESDLDGTPTNSIAVATGGTYVGWITATAGTVRGSMVADVSNVTADSLTVPRDGVYSVAWGVSASGTVNTTIICCAHVGGSIVAGSPCAARKIGTGGDVGDFGKGGDLTLSASAVVDLRCTSAVGDDSISINLWQVSLKVTELQ